MDRRKFINRSAAALAALSISGLHLSFKSEKDQMQYRKLGKTGLKVSLIGIGGHHIGASRVSEELSISIIRKALDAGVNFLDNAHCYHDGRSEVLMGKALQEGYREKAILMTKHHGRVPEDAEKELEASLKNLQTDYIDVWQFHDVQSLEEVEKIKTSGVLDFALEAKKKGKVKHIGFTGHVNPTIHKAMLDIDFDWETVQMPVNVLDYHYLSFTQEIIPLLTERNIGIIAMKTAASGKIVKSNIAKISECLHFAMSMPVSTVVSGIDNFDHLSENVGLAKTFTPMQENQIASLLERTLEPSVDGKNEWYKSSKV